MEINIHALPESPGCYIFRDKEHNCLYVGKSKNIKNRVRSYFNNSNPPKTKKLAKLISHIEYVSADSELMALYLEHGLIKTHRPPFNKQMKKDFRPHYICIEWARAKPGIYIHTRPGNEATRYGSFFSDYDAREAITLINRVWGTPICEKTHFDNVEAERGCLNMHISRCIGPCMGITVNDYLETLKRVANFMTNKNKKTLREIEIEMNQAATDMDYEKAARLRDILDELYSLQKRFTYQISFTNRRIVVFIKGHHEAGFRLLCFRNGELDAIEQFASKESTDWHDKREKLIRMLNKQIAADNLQEMSKIYTTSATQEIRANKYYTDITKTPTAHLAKKLDKAYLHFIRG